MFVHKFQNINNSDANLPLQMCPNDARGVYFEMLSTRRLNRATTAMIHHQFKLPKPQNITITASGKRKQERLGHSMIAMPRASTMSMRCWT